MSKIIGVFVFAMVMVVFFALRGLVEPALAPLIGGASVYFWVIAFAVAAISGVAVALHFD